MNDNYLDILKENLIQHQVDELILESDFLQEGIFDLKKIIDNVDSSSQDKIKSSLKPVLNNVKSLLNKYGIDSDKINNLVKKDSKRFLNSLNIDESKDGKDEAKRILPMLKKYIQKNFKLSKKEQQEVELKVRKYTIHVIVTLLVMVWSIYTIIIGIATPATIVILLWCAYDLLTDVKSRNLLLKDLRTIV